MEKRGERRGEEREEDWGKLKGGTLGEKRGREGREFKDVKTFDVPQLVRFSIKSDFRPARFHFDEVHKKELRRGAAAEYSLNVDSLDAIVLVVKESSTTLAH